MNQGAFLAAISAKGPTPEEMAGAWEAIYETDTTKVAPLVQTPLVDNCGTGMDGFKTFNISTAASIVAAAAGVHLARHGARAITSRCGTVDLCEALGVDVEADAEVVKESIEQSGIGLFNGMSSAIHPQALFRVLSQVSFGSILNISASLANPAKPLRGVRGVYAPEMVLPVARTMRAIGVERALVFHGATDNSAGGMDELSPLTESLTAELSADGRIRTFSVNPQQTGVGNGFGLDEIAAGHDPGQEALRLLRVLTGKDRGALYETICLNAAPILYIADRVPDLKQGVALSRELIDKGDALAKLNQWVGCQHREPDAGRQCLERLLAQI